MPKRKRRRWLIGLVLFVPLVGAAAVGGITLHRWMAEGAELARRHVEFEVTHKGWSYPSRIYSRPVPLDAPAERLFAEARIRGYVADCESVPPPPGTFCEKAGRVVPREGFLLEPVLLGWMIGPDAEIREHLPLERAPRHLLHALIASEDREFHGHSGVNLRAMLRATFANLQEGGYAQGGSTLTMQVVRSLSGQREKALVRKLQEMGHALGLERELGKERVLQMYLDVPYLGQLGGLSVCGFAAAARHYFDKDVSSLTMAEAATLVAILPSPGTLGPKIGTDEVRVRTRRVLQAMEEQFGDDIREALDEEVLRVEAAGLTARHPSYLSATRLWLEANVPAEVLYGHGLVIETGIDLPLQAQTEQLFDERIPAFAKRLAARNEQPLQAAGVAIDPDSGLIRAIYGGVGATVSGLNRALQSRRQPGSSFKPVVFALAFSLRLEDGAPRFTAASTEPNLPRVFDTPDGPWRPRNIGDYTPTASLADALVRSMNVATASLLEDLGGPDPLIDFASRLGFDTSRYPHEPGVALGQAEATPLEMTEFVALVVNGGRRVVGRPVWRASDVLGREWVTPPSAGDQVLSPEAAALTRELMRGVIEQGTGITTRSFEGEPGYTGLAIGKTGTTDDEKDMWFVGATPALAMSVWVGYDEPARVGATAMEVAAPLWGWWMRRAMVLADPGRTFPAEPKLQRRVICAETGRLAGSTCHRVAAPFLPGTAPKDSCEVDHSPEELETAKAP